ncbi:MAG: iron ABC transporter permease [Chloroflexi bacterium]|nr:iron ABC transporter permease [Chloroflexota bacterium]
MKRFKPGFLLWFVPTIFLLAFFLLPLGTIFQTVVQKVFQEGLNTLDLSVIWKPLYFTFWQAGLSTLLTMAVGLPAAYVLSRYQFRLKFLFKVLTTLPFILPTVVVAAGFNALLGPNGWVNLALMKVFDLASPPIQILNTFGAILLAHIFYNTTIIIRVVGSALEQMDPRMESAARVLGASPLKTLFEITIPLLRRPILAAALLVFLFDFTSFGVILLLGGAQMATLEVEVYIQALHLLNLPMAGLLSLIQLICTLAISLVYLRVIQGTSVSISPRLHGEGIISVKTWKQRLFLGVTLLFLAVLILLPLGALGARSFTRLEADRGERGQFRTGLTTQYYSELFTNPRGSLFYVPPIQAVKNSLIFAGAATFLSLLLGIMAAYAFQQTGMSGKWLDLLLMLPLGTSAVTLGLGYIILLSRLPIDIQYYPFLIPVVHSLVALPFVVRTIQPAIVSIPPTLRQAAAMQGASPWQTWKEVDLPIILRSILAAAIFAFTISLGEFGATTFLARPEYPTIPVAIYRFLSQPGGLNYGQAMAMATILMVTCGISIALLEWIQKPGQKYL